MSEFPRAYCPEIGDIVWAKMKPWRPWPGEVCEPPSEKSPKKKAWIYFYGTENYGWIENNCLWPFQEFKDMHMKARKINAKSFLDAVATAEENFATRSKNAGTGKPRVPEKKKKSDQSTKSSRPVKRAAEASGEASTSGEKSAKRKKTGKSQKKSVNLEQPDQELTSESSYSMQSGDGESDVMSVEDNSQEADDIPAEAPEVEEVLPEFEIRDEDSDDSDDEFALSGKKPTIGVLGIGRLGGEITSRLLNSKHSVTIWNRSESKLQPFLDRGAKKGASPADVFRSCDITLVCVSSAEVAKKLTFMRNGLHGVANPNCKLVVFTVMSPEDSLDVSEPLRQRGVCYLEAPVWRKSGRPSRKAIREGKMEHKSLVVLAGGDEQLYKDCASIFRAISKYHMFLGPIGSASTTALIVYAYVGSLVAGLGEGMSLADKISVDLTELLHIISVSPLGSAFLVSKGKAMIERNFAGGIPLEHVQGAMKCSLNHAAQYNHSMPLASMSHEVYVAANRYGHGSKDLSAIFLSSRF